MTVLTTKPSVHVQFTCDVIKSIGSAPLFSHSNTSVRVGNLATTIIYETFFLVIYKLSHDEVKDLAGKIVFFGCES